MKTKKPSGTEDTNVFKCKRCGFPCDLSRDKTGPGSGLTHPTETVGTETIYNPTVVSGCPFCGSRNYINWKR